jgi:hypothetical protein
VARRLLAPRFILIAASRTRRVIANTASHPLNCYVDFEAWEKRLGPDAAHVGGVPITRHWLIPQDRRPKVYAPHPVMSPDEIRARTQAVWDEFYGLRRIVRGPGARRHYGRDWPSC